MIGPFSVSRLPEILFGAGAVAALPDRIAAFGRRFLLVTGARSLKESRRWPPLREALHGKRLVWVPLVVSGEPSPDFVDAAVEEHRGAGFEAVVGIGGGSVLDAAKAVAGLLPSGRSVLDHLEDVGRGVPYTGPALPFLAVPTTAGTGSEATKNAVLSVVREKGFKKSFRDDALVARAAIVDPDLLETCPKPLLAADGMDALTQLLEAYTSTRASAFTDALSESGLAAARDGLLPWYEETGEAADARSKMAYASLLSGIVLAQAGLGAVHGLAQPLGSYFPIPHGVVCGTLVAAATRANVAALRARDPEGVALAKYARAWRILAELDDTPSDAPERLVALLEEWTERLRLPRLGTLGVTTDDLPRLVAGSRGSSMKSNSILLEDAEIERIVRERL